MRLNNDRLSVLIAVLCAVVFALAFSGTGLNARAQEEVQDISQKSIPIPSLEHLEEIVQGQIRDAQSKTLDVLRKTDSPPTERGEAIWELGLVYHAYELTDSAEECYRRAIDLDQSRFEWNYCLGFLLQTTGRFDEALRYYQEALSLQPDFSLISVRIGESYRSLNKPRQARQSFEAAFRLSPEEQAIRARLGELSVDEKKYEEAVEILESVLQQQPGADKLHYPLAMAYRGMGEMEKARHHLSLRGVVGIQPPDPLLTRLKKLARGSRTLILRGKLAYSAGRYEEAAEAFRSAIETAPEDPGARINLGSTLARQRKYHEAVVHLKEALRLAPDNVTAHYNLGSLFIALGEYGAAADHLQTVVRQEPKDPVPYLLLAEALKKEGRFAESFERYKTAVRLDKTLTSGWMEMSSQLELAGQYAEALLVLEEAHSHLPHEEQVSQYLARHLAASPDQSLRDGTRALDLAIMGYEKGANFQKAEIMAMAYAELDLCAKAAEWQHHAIDLALSAQSLSETREKLKRNLVHYQTKKPCRVPGGTTEEKIKD